MAIRQKPDIDTVAVEAAQPNMKGRDRMTRLADLLFEVGMLRKTPRSGYQFLGSGRESVAEHSFRTAVIGLMLADLAGADVERTALMCLFHDLHEARTGDFNYVNHIYCRADRTAALEHATYGTGLSDLILSFWHELENMQTLEARLAQDADQLDMILSLKEEMDLGNLYAAKWMQAALKRVKTEWGCKLAEAIRNTDHTDWWFLGPDRNWWENRNGGRDSEEEQAESGS